MLPQGEMSPELLQSAAFLHTSCVHAASFTMWTHQANAWINSIESSCFCILVHDQSMERSKS